MIFVRDPLAPHGAVSEPITVELVDSNSQRFSLDDVDVRSVPNFGFSQVVFRLPSGLASGECTIRVAAVAGTKFSNTSIIRIAGP